MISFTYFLKVRLNLITKKDAKKIKTSIVKCQKDCQNIAEKKRVIQKMYFISC